MDPYPLPSKKIDLSGRFSSPAVTTSILSCQKFMGSELGGKYGTVLIQRNFKFFNLLVLVIWVGNW